MVRGKKLFPDPVPIDMLWLLFAPCAPIHAFADRCSKAGVSCDQGYCCVLILVIIEQGSLLTNTAGIVFK